MGTSGVCQECGEGSVILDPVYGIMACDACGRVVDEMETELGAEHQVGHVMERGGTFVGGDDTGSVAGRALSLHGGGLASHISCNLRSRQDSKKMDAMNRMQSITAVLRVPTEIVENVKFMMENAMEGEWGEGRWIDILVGACVYIAIRQSHLPLTLVEVAGAVDCDIVELARMCHRVCQCLEMSMPEADPVIFLDRAVSTLPDIKKLGKDMARKLSKQGSLLLKCAREWFITTGRRTLPVVAAVLFLLVEANEVKVTFAEVVRGLYTNLRTSRARFKELQEALVGVGQDLPWGKDITRKTLQGHLPFLLQYLDNRNRKRKAVDVTSPSTLVINPLTSPKNNIQQELPNPGMRVLVVEEFEARNVDPVFSPIPLQIRLPPAKQARLSVPDSSVESQPVREWNSKQAMWVGLPQSFLRSEEVRKKRRLKISAAMQRIAEIKQALTSQVAQFTDPSSSSQSLLTNRIEAVSCPCERSQDTLYEGSGKISESTLDWEDLVIEYLLLRRVDAKEIEGGYYNSILALHPVHDSMAIRDDELQQYLRSQEEVDLMQIMDKEGKFWSI